MDITHDTIKFIISNYGVTNICSVSNIENYTKLIRKCIFLRLFLAELEICFLLDRILRKSVLVNVKTREKPRKIQLCFNTFFYIYHHLLAYYSNKIDFKFNSNHGLNLALSWVFGYW